MKTLKITIDTNILIYLFDQEAEEENVNKTCAILKTIFESQKYINVYVQISTSTEDDLLQDNDSVRRKYLQSRIRRVFQQVSSGEFIKVGNEVQPRNSDDLIFFNELQRILFPNINFLSNSYINKIKVLSH